MNSDKLPLSPPSLGPGNEAWLQCMAIHLAN